MLDEVQLVAWELRVEVLLKVCEAESVAFFISSVVVSVLLQAVISQVDVVVSALWVVFRGGGPEVAVFVIEKLVLACGHCPHPDIELPAFEQQRLLYVLLDDPQRVDRLGPEALLDLFQAPADLDALALVQSCRFDQPHVFFTVLRWSAFFVRVHHADLVKSV